MKKYLRCILSLCLMAYLAVALSFTSKFSSEELCRGLTIVVNDSTERRFVTANELAKELGTLPSRITSMRLDDVDTDSITRLLRAIDKIEHVRVVKMTDHTVRITVDPMIPVARIFDGSRSYYINREGKRISASPRYHVDVPIIQGHFIDSVFPPTAVLPLVEYIMADSVWNPLMSMIKVDSPTDIMFVPIVRGQIVNLGDMTHLDSKFHRLKRFYTEVLSVKGWDYYDTISVKWGGQVVASRRHKVLPSPFSIIEEEDEAVDVGTMLAAEGVAPGRTRPGQKAHSEKPIPASHTVFAASNDAESAAGVTAATAKGGSGNSAKSSPSTGDSKVKKENSKR